MRNIRLLSSTAALALLIGAGIAPAQDVKQIDAAPERAPAAQQKAPAEKIAPPMHNAQQKPRETTGQGAPGEPATLNENKAEPQAPKPEIRHAPDNKGSLNEHGKADVKAGEKSSENTLKPAASDKSSQATNPQAHETTGQGAASGSAKLSTEQRTKITTVFKKHRVAPTHLNVSVSVGTRVPANVRFYPVPVEVIAIYPEWRGYDYILVGDEIVIIDPRSHEIVAVLEA